MSSVLEWNLEWMNRMKGELKGRRNMGGGSMEGEGWGGEKMGREGNWMRTRWEEGRRRME
jgi:hypothetical protein